MRSGMYPCFLESSQNVVVSHKRPHDKAFVRDDDTPLEEHELDDLAGHIQRHWRRVGRQLNLSESTLTEIELRNSGHNSEREKAFQMFLEWRERYPECFKKGRLHNVLVHCGLNNTSKRFLLG